MGYFKLLRQLRGGDLLPLKQDGQNTDEPVRFHVIPPPSLHLFIL
ncbi:hypothetical protein ANACOL_04140 [Anaerotruncus colihominis DSM 17241]|uniref:Uncharacterized protein n=1 Tax=Anaerotruncus colihominis DSM 17241 TaxID=445972 RepID=B0PGI7_9FIRM|nr:hypothetical protein ANACOL_04140 [Anaerotruncus colihominis DSM 17241]